MCERSSRVIEINVRERNIGAPRERIPGLGMRRLIDPEDLLSVDRLHFGGLE